MTRDRLLMTACLFALVSPAPAAAQESATRAESAVLDGIDRSLKQIVELLRIQVGNQRAELAVQRLDIARRELVSRERELHNAEAQRDDYARQQQELGARIEAYGSTSLEESGMQPEAFEYMRRQIELESEALKQNAWRADQRIIDLRQEIVRVREDLDTWEELVVEAFVPD